MLPGPVILLLAVGAASSLGRETQLQGEECEDGYIECGAMAESCQSRDVATVLRMLTHCRATCAALSAASMPVAELLGGTNTTVLDTLGTSMPVCSESQGVDSVLRHSLLRHRLATVVQPAWLPSFTRTGLEVREVPGRLMGMINMARVQGLARMEQEDCVPEVACFNCQKLVQDKRECKLPQHSGHQMIIPISQQLKDTILETLHPLAEEWARTRLLGTSVYGIRRYTTRGWLAAHLDRMDTHVISVIIHVAHGGGGTWPLVISDHQGAVHRVTLEPGQMLFYESAKLPHGRPEPFAGQFYDNIFVHFKPSSKNWWKVGGVRWDLGQLPAWKVSLEQSDNGRIQKIVKKVLSK